MKIKPSIELSFVIGILSIIAVIIEILFVQNIVLKIFIAATFVFVGTLIETKIERKWLGCQRARIDTLSKST